MIPSENSRTQPSLLTCGCFTNRLLDPPTTGRHSAFRTAFRLENPRDPTTNWRVRSMRKWTVALVLPILWFGAQPPLQVMLSAGRLPATGGWVAMAAHAQGDPVFNPQPPSTLLPAGATSVTLTVQSAVGTDCGFALGEAVPYPEMTAFATGTGAQS